MWVAVGCSHVSVGGSGPWARSADLGRSNPGGRGFHKASTPKMRRCAVCAGSPDVAERKLATGRIGAALVRGRTAEQPFILSAVRLPPANESQEERCR